MQTARLAERAPFSARVDVVPQGAPTSLSVWCQDLSETGMFVQTTEAFVVGDLLSLRFEVDRQPVHIRAAEVVWIRRFESVNVDGWAPGLGLRFVSIDPATRAALRRAVQSGRPDTVQATMSRAKASSSWPAMEAAASALPAPMLTLPPLSRSIIEASGARDLEDTQDLLPPPSAHRTPSAGMTFSQLPFRALEVSLPPDEPNLCAEARVFDGLAPTPRAISFAPEASLRRAPADPRAVTMGPRSASSPLSMPPLSTMSMIGSLPPATAEVQALMAGEPASRSIALPAPPLDPFAGWSFRRGEVAGTPSQPVCTDTRPEIENPSIIEAVSVPPTPAASLLPMSAIEVSDGYSLGGALHVAPSDGEPRFRDDGRDLTVKHLPLGQGALHDGRRRAVGHRRRLSFGPAVAFLALGCAAGAAVALLPSPLWSSSSSATSTQATTVAAVTSAPVETIVEAPRPVEVAEAELRAVAPAAVAPVEPAKVVEVAPPVEVVQPVEVAKVEARADLTPQPPLQRRGEGEPERKTRVEPTKIETATAEPSKIDPKREEPVLSSATRTARAPLGGRYAVRLPEGGRVLKSFALGAPARVVVDLAGASLPGTAVSVGEGGVEAVRFGRPAPDTQRVVVVLDGPGKPDAVDAHLDGDALIVTWQH